MIINNIHIQGIYLYDELAEYEKGDFIVYKNSIYQCTAKNPTNSINFTVSGKIPEEDKENFLCYLGEKISSAKEYFDYIENSEGEDKLLSSYSLSEILNYYMCGFSEKGIIKDYINYENEEYSFSKELDNLLSGVMNNYLDEIIKSENLNNCILTISRELPEIKIMIPNIPEDATNIEDIDKKSVILKQYTYLETSKTPSVKIRVQELIVYTYIVITIW